MTEKNNMKTENDLNEKLTLLDIISDCCLTCTKPFNKYSWKMAMVWHVTILEEPDLFQQERVNLYCPDCTYDAMKLEHDEEEE